MMRSRSLLALFLLALFVLPLAGATAGPPQPASGGDIQSYAFPLWSTGLIDGSGGTLGLYPSLAFDAYNKPHITYYDATNADLKYYEVDCSGYACVRLYETIDSTGDVGQYSSLAIDAGGWPHVSYHDETNGDLQYAYKDATGWHTETVVPDFHTGEYTSLALDSQDHPHISYYDATRGVLRYVSYDGSAWTPPELVDDVVGVDSGRYSSLKLDFYDYPRISYYDVTNGDLKYAWADSSGWYPEVVYSTGDVGQYSSLDLEPGGFPRIAFYDATNGDLLYSFADGSGWHTWVVDSAGDSGRYCSLAVDADGYSHIGYYDTTNKALRYLYLEGFTWRYQIIAIVPGLDQEGQRPAIALDSYGMPRISYQYTSTIDGYLMYAWAGHVVYLPYVCK